MECFEGLVTVKDLCATVDPKSQIWLDDVGLSKVDLEDFITEQYPTILEYYNERAAFAVKSVASEVYNHFAGKYITTSIVDSHRLGFYDSRRDIIVGDGYRGINMNFQNETTFYSFTISELTLFLDYTGNVDVVIYDLLQDKLLHTETIACVAGKQSTAYIHKTFESAKYNKNIFVGYNSTGKDSYKSVIKSGLCCGNISCSNSYMNAVGCEIDGTEFIEANVEQLSHTSGLSLTYSLDCDHMSWMCANAKSLAFPIAYKIAEILVSDGLFATNGKRATNAQTINREELQNKYDFYRGKYREYLTSCLSNMRLPTNNKCFACNQTHRNVIALP